ncbi:sensor histidine kinase [Rosettibacter firmus]|uniref:sensor histidine kinase n=1 Tax=Rosettibacter firmus TaxID=3111522 RepID=UPI00336BDD21
MLLLLPDWAKNYGEFWRAIQIRNLWFIKLRYLVVILLICFLLSGEFLFKFNFTRTQIIAISTITFSILVYNILLHIFRKYVGCSPDKFNSLHLSLIQMILDLIALLLLVYFTGLIESPLYIFFIFHMIIGSLILPGYLVYVMAGVVSFLFTLLIALSKISLIKIHLINGLYSSPVNNTLSYELITLVSFIMMLFASVYLANNIARQLYRREQLLRTSLQKIDEAEKSKQKYIIGIVHEIKTPVTAIKSIIDVVLQHYVGAISKEAEEKLNRAKIRTEETLSLLNNVLRISRLKLLDIRSAEEIDINSFIQNIIEKQNESIKAKNIELLFEDRRKVKKFIKSDMILLELALSNIISNSIKYVNQNGRIEVIIDDVDDKISIEVCDNGIGIPKEDLPKIFNQFYRASNIDKTKHEGSGMGLAITKEIIERLGGEINVISPSRLAHDNFPGSCFKIITPYYFKPSTYDIFEVNPEDYLSSKNTLEGSDS